MNHAVFWVTPRSRADSQELIPFLQFTTSHRAASHLSRPRGESSKIVPVRSEPRGFLGNSQVAGGFAGTDTVLAIHNPPQGGKPFIQAQGGILEDSSGLEGDRKSTR